MSAIDRRQPDAAQPAEPDCPMLRLAGFLLDATAIVDLLDDDMADEAFRETMGPAWAALLDRTPPTRSHEGVVAALGALLLSEELDEGSERVVASALAFLRGESPQ